MKKKNLTPPRPTRQSPTNYGLWLVKNLLFASFIGFCLLKGMESNEGYKWAYTMLKNNREIIRKNPNLTLKKKNEMKLGIDFAYICFLKESTPDNAVILYPSSEDFYPPDKSSPFKQPIQNKIWALRFLYPRHLVLPSEMETNRYTPAITHVAIVNGRGYERLDYPIENKQEYGIWQIKP
jgi:hypothetical protein